MQHRNLGQYLEKCMKLYTYLNTNGIFIFFFFLSDFFKELVCIITDNTDCNTNGVIFFGFMYCEWGKASWERESLKHIHPNYLTYNTTFLLQFHLFVASLQHQYVILMKFTSCILADVETIGASSWVINLLQNGSFAILIAAVVVMYT